MSFKTISTIVTDQNTDLCALNVARQLAQREDAHLDVHCVGIDPTRYEALPAGSAIIIEQGREDAVKRAASLSSWVREDVTATDDRVGVEGAVIAQLSLDSTVSRLSRYSDLVVCAQPYTEHSSPISVMVLEAVMFGGRSPILVVPEGMREVPKFKTVTVAWNESDEAMAAIRQAMPILAAADRVDVVMIDPPARSAERSDPGGALSLMLARHGAKCEVSILSKTMPRVADILMRFMEDRDSDLLVMGAYGHSRFREALLGGATRDLLEETTRPVFMAH